jgi:hypothetical protein
MNPTCQNTMLKIKSPQLYRLSYQPEALVFQGEDRATLGAVRVDCACRVPSRETCPVLPQAEAAVQAARQAQPSTTWIGGTVLAASLLEVSP